MYSSNSAGDSTENQEKPMVHIPEFVTGNSNELNSLAVHLYSIIRLTYATERQSGDSRNPSRSIGDDVLIDIHRNLDVLMNPQNINVGEFRDRFAYVESKVTLARSAGAAFRDFDSNSFKYKTLIAGIYLEQLLFLAAEPYNNKKDSIKVVEDVLKELSDVGGAIGIDKNTYRTKLHKARESGILETAEALLSSSSWSNFFKSEHLLLQTDPFQHGIEFTSTGIERWKRLLEKSAELLPKMLDAAIERQIEMLEEQAWRNEPGRRVYTAQLLTRAKVTRGTNKELVSQLEKVVAQYPL